VESIQGRSAARSGKTAQARIRFRWEAVKWRWGSPIEVPFPHLQLRGHALRPTKLCRALTGIPALYASRCDIQEKAIVFQVRPRARKKRCGCCGEVAPGYDQMRKRAWRCESYGDHAIELRYAPGRVDCPRCGVHVEQVPWARHGSRFTRDFEEKVAYLARITNQTAVAKLRGCRFHDGRSDASGAPALLGRPPARPGGAGSLPAFGLCCSRAG